MSANAPRAKRTRQVRALLITGQHDATQREPAAARRDQRDAG
jgi:hypothetical protein